jgi:hypothetical protein
MIPAVAISELLQLVWVAPLAAVAVTITFSLCVLGAERSTDARRSGQAALGSMWFALALVSGTAMLAAIAAGIYVIVSG